MSDKSPKSEIGGRYAWYVLIVLMFVYVFNFIDRQILSILAEDIKASIGISDAQIGFLYGTAFAVFYAVFGIPLGRLADVWVRKSLISVGLFFWSAMTALSGTANSFFSLAGFRIGVGVGESSASPAAFSILGDYFSPKFRASALAIYSSGIYIGSGIGLFLGGLVVDRWGAAYPDGDSPLGLEGWQAAFFIVGLPGLLMAIWVWTLREPVRGQSEGITSSDAPADPIKAFRNELIAIVPPFTIYSLWRAGAGGRGLAINLAVAALILLGAWGLVLWLGEPAQWFALAVGLYAFFSWSQGLALRDRPCFAMIFRTPSLVLAVLAFSTVTFVTYGLGFWFPPFFIRVHGVTAGEAGMYFGLATAVGGWAGVTGGGLLSDRIKRITPRARPYFGIASALLMAPVALFMLTTPSIKMAYAAAFFYNAFSSCWIGSAVATPNELVLPRMRGTASAFYILSVTFIGLAMGPFTVGRVSDVLVRGGADGGDALRTAMTIALAALGLSLVLFVLAARYIERDESTRIERARSAGEQGL